MAARAGRAVLALLAVGAVVVFAYGLRAVTLRQDGEAIVKRLGQRPDPAAVAQAQDDFRRAGRLNADPTPELDAAALALRTGRARAAAGMLERVVRDNAGSLRGWALLAAATEPFDVERSTRANAELLDLYGRRQGLPISSGVIPAPDGRRFEVTPGRVTGSVDSTSVKGTTAKITGWAGQLSTKAPAQLVLVVSRGRVVASVPTYVRRSDLATTYGPGLRYAGFRVSLPRARLVRDGKLQVQVFGAVGQTASALPIQCKSQQAFGC
jgi:hypothetical protein